MPLALNMESCLKIRTKQLMANYLHYRWWLAPALLLSITPFMEDLDLGFSRLFFSDGTFIEHPILSFLFAFGVFPAYAPCALIVICLATALYLLDRKYWTVAITTILLSLGLGSGLLINGILKNSWNRPRPKQIQEFSGPYPYSPYYRPYLGPAKEPLKGFPCGHCTMGYLFFSLYHLGRRFYNQSLKVCSLTLALGIGTALGLGRVAQGGHFFSDVALSCLIMWMTPQLILAFHEQEAPDRRD